MQDLKKYYIKNKMFLCVLLFLLTAQSVCAADVYVDINSANTEENGSEENPYHTITTALTKISSNPQANRQIYIKSGVYSEELTLPDYTTLTGVNKDSVIIDRDNLEGSTITTGANTVIENITVKGGNYGINIPSNNKTSINNCIIQNTKRIGVSIERGTNQLENEVVIYGSSISNNIRKGIYGEERFIYLINNNVSYNGEEGIDLRSNMRGTISGNNIERNSEGGIELEIRRTAIEISGNNLNYNRSNGITLNNRTHVGGKVLIKNNTITNNYHYGIRCAGSKTWSKKLWKKSIKNSKNSIVKNVKKNISNSCKRK